VSALKYEQSTDEGRLPSSTEYDFKGLVMKSCNWPLAVLQACLAEAGFADIALHPCPVAEAYRGPLDLARFTQVSNYHFITASKPLAPLATAERAPQYPPAL
jgi:hypothetical protein